MLSHFNVQDFPSYFQMYTLIFTACKKLSHVTLIIHLLHNNFSFLQHYFQHLNYSFKKNHCSKELRTVSFQFYVPYASRNENRFATKECSFCVHILCYCFFSRRFPLQSYFKNANFCLGCRETNANDVKCRGFA